MAVKQDLVYSRGRSKFVAPSCRLVIRLDDDGYIVYVPPGTQTPTCAANTTRGSPTKVAHDVVNAFQFDEECTLTDPPFGSASGLEGAPGFEEASDAMERRL